jgi:hypothetical protein
MNGKSAQEHVDRYAERFADELQPILHIDGVTRNGELRHGKMHSAPCSLRETALILKKIRWQSSRPSLPSWSPSSSIAPTGLGGR